MAQTFIPKDTIYVDAPSRGKGYKYKVSFGVEAWAPNVSKDVFKIQLEENGKVKGRLNTSLPTEGHEASQVVSALNQLLKKHS